MVRNIFPWLSGLVSVITWFSRESIKSWFFDKVVHQMNPVESSLVEYGLPVAFGALCIWLFCRREGSSVATLPASASAAPGKPELKMSVSGGNIFTLQSPDLRDQLTGIALNVKVWNTGTPSVAISWNLNVIVPGRIPVRAQLTNITDQLPLGGAVNSLVIHPSESLERKTSATQIEMIPIDGILLFYVAIDKDVIMQSNVQLEISVRDVFGLETRVMHRMGDWMNR